MVNHIARRDVIFSCADLDWEKHVEIDPRYLRPAEVDDLRGAASKARHVLGWEPTITYDQLIRETVEHDRELARREQTLLSAGHTVTPRGAF